MVLVQRCRRRSRRWPKAKGCCGDLQLQSLMGKLLPREASGRCNRLLLVGVEYSTLSCPVDSAVGLRTN